MGCRGVLALVPGATSSPTYSLTLVLALLFFSLFVPFSSACVVFSAFSEVCFPRGATAWLTGSALASGGSVEAGRTCHLHPTQLGLGWSYGRREEFSH